MWSRHSGVRRQVLSQSNGRWYFFLSPGTNGWEYRIRRDIGDAEGKTNAARKWRQLQDLSFSPLAPPHGTLAVLRFDYRNDAFPQLPVRPRIGLGHPGMAQRQRAL
jgi:hypothetical protein